MVGDIIIDGVSIDSVGVKTKGNSSFNNPSQKKSFKIDLNQFVSGKEFDGIKKFNLNNGFKDPTFLREKISYDCMRETGIPAPRCGFANVYLNNQYWGVYTVVEEVNKKFLTQRFSENDSNLYKGDPHGDLKWKGANPADYYPHYTLETNENTSNDWRGLVHFIDKINFTPAQNFYDSLEKVMDTQTFLKNWAMTNLFVNLDSYIGSGHNYYIYHAENDNKMHWIAWDFNEAFGNFKMNLTSQQLLNYSLFSVGNPGSRPLIEKMAANTLYRQQLADITCNLLHTYFTQDYLFPKIDSLANAIRPHVYLDTKKTYSNAHFDTNLTQDITVGMPILGLKPFIQARISFIENELLPYGCFGVSIIDKEKNLLSLYPNPVQDNLHVNLSNHTTGYTVEVSDMCGNLLLTHENIDEIPVQTLATGFYICKVIATQTGETLVQKFWKN
jgi:spore coat protein CotH